MFQNTFILRRPGVDSFADIIKIAIKLIKISIKDLINANRIRNYVLELLSVFAVITKTDNCWRKMLMSAKIKGCIALAFIFFGSSLINV